MHRYPLLACALLSFTIAALPAASYVWWEAEDAVAQNFDPEHPFMPAHEELSGGRWIGIDNKQPRSETVFAEYQITVPSDGRYKFYARKFWKHGPFRFRFGDGPWHQVGRDIGLLDTTSLRTHLGANWVDCGWVKLEQGATEVRIELLEDRGAACFDAFLLSSEPVSPRGALKPGERYERASEGWFAFEPGRDPFNDSAIDLRRLNEAEAGSKGFIQADGPRFVHADTGESLRFWGVNINHSVLNMSRDDIDQLARWYAKHGVNLVRFHGPVFGDDSRSADPAILDKLFYTVAAMKREGIYFHLSIYFQHWHRMNQAKDQHTVLADFGYKDGQRPFALHFINHDFQAIMRGWWRDLLTTINPHTGLTLAQDAAVMGAELINEDNYFFFTFHESVPEPQLRILEARFADWAAQRFGSVEQALAAWQEPHDRDAPAEGRLGLHTAWEMGHRRTDRAQACARFLAEDERAFFTGMAAYLKEELGFGGVVCATNWKTAQGRYLEPVEKWANGGVDFMDHHGYFYAPFKNEDGIWGIGTGDQYRDRSATRFDPGRTEQKSGQTFSYDNPFNLLVWHDQPHMISEISWAVPNRFRGEQALIGASLGRLQGLDAIVWFAAQRPDWSSSLGSFWPVEVPSQIGQWPAAALLYRQGLLAEAEPAISVTLGTDAILDLAGMPVTQSTNYDAMQAEVAEAGGGLTMGIGSDSASDEKLAFWVGPIHVGFQAGNESSVEQVALDRYIDREQQQIRSLTDELLWDWGRGLLRVDAPRAQAVAGFIGANSPVELEQLRIQTELEYLVLMLVPLDDKPVAESEKLLLQVFTEDRSDAWQEQTGADGWRTITDKGRPPVVVRNINGSVSLKRSDAGELRVTALDGNGYPAGDAGHADSIALQPETLYYLIERP